MKTARRVVRLAAWMAVSQIVGVTTAMTATMTAAIALPPPDDIPEEVLRTEIITEARSPIDGKALTAAEYAALQEDLQDHPPPELDSQVQHIIFLLQIRRAIRRVAPFLLN
ncbi:MAG TPA: hypothetical protein V6C88_16235 [Chroococcidiopsis sp.]